MPLTPTHESVDDRGYRYVETSEEWMEACRPLPCFPQLWWPDYATKVIEDTIDGKPVVIQLWKGWCQQFLNLKNMPGGVGGEVGVYARMPGRHIAESIPDLPDPFVAKIREKVAGLGDKDLWWPYPESELQTTIDFEFINPQTGETVFRADPKASVLADSLDGPFELPQLRRRPAWRLALQQEGPGPRVGLRAEVHNQREDLPGLGRPQLIPRAQLLPEFRLFWPKYFAWKST